LQQTQLGFESERPSSLETPIVEKLGIPAGKPLEAPLRIQHMHQMHQTHLPWPQLLRDRRLQRARCGTVSAAGIEIDEVDPLHAIRL
jgi:hypothetical protein